MILGRFEVRNGFNRVVFRDVGCESALPPRTDILGSVCHVGKGPGADYRDTLALTQISGPG
jgi:hypothetical protein